MKLIRAAQLTCCPGFEQRQVLRHSDWYDKMES